jgi:hypothetical protein
LFVESKYFEKGPLAEVFRAVAREGTRRVSLNIRAVSDEEMLKEEVARWPRQMTSLFFCSALPNEKSREGMRRFLGEPPSCKSCHRADYFRNMTGEEYFGYTRDPDRDYYLWFNVEGDSAKEYGKKNLVEAIEQGDLFTIKRLIDQGVRRSIPAPALLLFQPKHNKEETVRWLLWMGESIEGRWGGLTPLMNAAVSGDAELVRILLGAGADANADNGFAGQTALTLAALHQRPAVVEALVMRQTDLNRKDRNGITALMYAVINEDLRSANALLSRGANPDVRDLGGGTALSLCQRWESNEMVDLLVDAGADVNARNDKGQTPLMAAAKCGQLKAVDALVKRGADVLLVDRKGRSALDFARKSVTADQRVIDLLESATSR